MKKWLQLSAAVTVICFSTTAFGQSPVITGDNMLCPEGTGTLTTGVYPSYQWYQRYYGSTDTVLISGATSQTLSMDYYTYAASYMIVEVDNGGTLEMSPEYFVDGWAFASPTVMTSGDFTTGPNGEAVICDGDSLVLEFMLPYNTNITWYDSGNAIPNEHNQTLIVTTAGSYTVSGAPPECPNFFQNSGVPVDVIVQNCSSTGLDENAFPQARIYPNPTTGELTIEHDSETIGAIAIHNTTGQLVQSVPVNQLAVTLHLDRLEKGTYFVTIQYGNRMEVQKISMQ